MNRAFVCCFVVDALAVPLPFRVRCVLHVADPGEQQEERVVRRVLGGELQLQTDELLQEGREQQEVHRSVRLSYFLLH